MYAVVRTGGKQYRVSAGDILEVEKLGGEVGDSIALGDVLMIGSGEGVTVGQPTVENASVEAKITGQYRGKKIRIMRYRPKKRIRVRRGHRQYRTRLEIASIRHGDDVYELEVAPESVVAPVAASPDEDAWEENAVEEIEDAVETQEVDTAVDSAVEETEDGIEDAVETQEVDTAVDSTVEDGIEDAVEAEDKAADDVQAEADANNDESSKKE